MKTMNYRKLWLGFDRALAHNLLRQMIIIGVILIFAFGISCLLLSFSGAEWDAFCRNENISKWLLPFYLLIDASALSNLYMGGDGTFVSGTVLLICSLTFLVGTFFFNGVIIAIFTNSIEQRVSNFREGRIHYLKSGHHIIMGYDDIVPSIINSIFEDKQAYVLLLSSMKTVDLREKLSKSFDKKQMKRIIINYGHRTSIDTYKDIHLESSEQIYVVGNQQSSVHDAINVECVDSICRYLEKLEQREKPSRITCVFKDMDTYAAFKTSEIFEKVMDLDIEFVPYNIHMGWAKQVFVKRKYKDLDNPGVEYDYPAVYGEGITPEDKKYVHLVFVGTTNFAVAFALEAAHVLHFPNADNAKTRITFIDRNADIEKKEFIIRNRHFFEVQSYTYKDLSEDKEKEQQGKRNEYVVFTDENSNFLDVEFEFIKGDIFSKSVQDEIDGWAKEHNEKQYLSIFLTMTDQRKNFVLGMNMPDTVYENGIPVFLRQERSDNLVTNLRNADRERNERYANIYPFGMYETAYSADNHSLKRAKLINYLYETANYETHKFIAVQTLDAIPKELIWENADRSWKKLSVALKWSSLYNAYTMRTKLATLRAMRELDIKDTSHDYQLLSDYETERLARVEHNRWNVEKLLMGFRKAHNTDDKGFFIHYDIQPFDKLNAIKELDYEFARYIPWIMRMTENYT